MGTEDLIKLIIDCAPDGLILNFGTTPMGICRKFKDKKQARDY